jgi:hypothetical protein
MATERQREAARRNIAKAREARARGHGSTAEKDGVRESAFAFPKERKEPLNDAKHVRNAIARFDQVEGVSDHERDEAWKRIQAKAEEYDVEITARSWHELMKGGKAKAR